MSEPLRIALVAEGPTDRIVLEAAIQAILNERPYVLTQLQPEGSLVFGERGTGWGGVYRWCKQSAERGKGRLANDRLIFSQFHILLLHLDADVAGHKYAEANIDPKQGDKPIPCDKPCPPPANTTNALRVVLLSWCGERTTPKNVVICMPSKSTEAWVVRALFPGDIAVRQGIECFANPESRLGQQPKRSRIRKCQRDYQDRSNRLRDAWQELLKLTEAARFQDDFEKALSRINSNAPAEG
jgi:hypothetical protein